MEINLNCICIYRAFKALRLIVQPDSWRGFYFS